MIEVTVVIPSVPTRPDLLTRALASVRAQTFPASAVEVEIDFDRTGAAATRQRALERVRTPYVAFLDDDDEFKPHHLEALLRAMSAEDAEMVFSWYDVVGGTDPRPDEFGLPWDPRSPRQTTVTTLARTDLALDVGGFIDPDDGPLDSPDRHYAGEDWLFTRRMNEAGKVYHLPERTWLWHHHGANTSGLPSRW